MSTCVNLKPPLTLDDQISLLSSRGLIIQNYHGLKAFLKENNYYRLNYYFHKFMDSTNNFIPGTDFLRIRTIYETDRVIRINILSVLEPIEIKLKSSIAYFLGIKHGADAFYKKDIFYDEQKYNELFSYFNSEIVNNPDNPVVKHHNKYYSGLFPIWVVVEFLTFGKSSKLFTNLKIDDQRIISRGHYNLNERLFTNWIYSLGVMRNICAHYGYLYKRGFSIPVNFGHDTTQFNSQKSSLFGIFYCIKKLSTQDDWKSFYTEIQNKIGATVLKNDYGFPSDFNIFES